MRSVSVPFSSMGESFKEDTRFKHGALVFLALSWIVSGIGVTMPFADNFVIKLLLLTPPFAISLLLTLLNPREGFALWSISLGFLVTQTGYQVDVGQIRLSALELTLVVLSFIFLLNNRSLFTGPPVIKKSSYICLILFVVYSIIIFAVSITKNVPFSAAVNEFKGFILYPFMAYVVAAGLRKYSTIRLSVVIIVTWYVFISGRGIWQFLQGETNNTLDDVFRASADYASINTYGITMVVACLLMLGIVLYMSDRRLKVVMMMVVIWLFLGAVASVSRTVWVAGGAGVFTLFLSGRKKKYAIGLLLIAFVLFLALPKEVSGRIDQLSDTSTEKRAFYLESGVQAWKASWLTGWGWGVAFWYQPGIGLIPTGEIPWYHNDYLNLAVQTGAIGLALYLGYWLQVLHAAHRWQRTHAQSDISGYMLGSMMALVALLVSAGLEHVLWKTDIAGLVGWVAGLMIACMRLGNQERSRIEPV